MKQFVRVIFLAISLVGYGAEQPASNDVAYFLKFEKKIAAEPNSVMVIKAEMVKYYLDSEKKNKDTRLLDRLKQNAALLEDHPEIYAIHALAVFELLRNNEDRLGMGPVITVLEEKTKQIDNPKLLIITENEIARYYNFSKKYDDVFLHTYRALRIARNTNDTTNIQTLYSNLAGYYFNLSKFSKAKDCLRKAIDFEKCGYRDGHTDRMLVLAILMAQEKNTIPRAIKIYEDLEAGIPEENKAVFYYNFACFYMDLEDFVSAKKYLLISKEYAEKRKDVALEYVYKSLAGCYSHLGDYERSYHYLSLKDSIVRIQQKEKYLFELESMKRKQLIRIQQLKKKNAEIRLSNERTKVLKLSLFLGFVVLVLLVCVRMIFYMRQKMKALVRINLEAMDKLNQKPPVHVQSQRKISDDLAQRMDRLLNEDQVFKDPEITTQKIASLLQTSVTEVSNTVNGFYGVSFRTLINNKRVELAKIMLIEEQYAHLSITGIGETVGYANSSSFYKHFKEITGVTPSHFQQFAKSILNEQKKQDEHRET